jgi:hypothetical protein
MTAKDDDFKEIPTLPRVTDWIRWDAESVNRPIEGTYLDWHINQYSFDGQERKVFIVEGSNGTIFGLNSTVRLAAQMAKVAPGDRVRVVYKGKEKDGENSVHTFSVARAGPK